MTRVSMVRTSETHTPRVPSSESLKTVFLHSMISVLSRITLYRDTGPATCGPLKALISACPNHAKMKRHLCLWLSSQISSGKMKLETLTRTWVFQAEVEMARHPVFSVTDIERIRAHYSGWNESPLRGELHPE